MATNIKLKSSSLAGKTPTLSDLSLRELAVNTADGKLFLRKGDGSGTDKIIDVTAPLQASEPMGHENKSQSVISFNTVNRRFTIQPVSTSFNVWCKGVKYNFTTAQTVDLPNTTGIYYIYFDGDGVLQYRVSYFDWENNAPTAYVYWNATTGTAPFVADERHGIVLDWQTHEYLHRTRGAVIANGFSISNYITTGDGSLDSDSQFDLGGGTFFDEDLEVIITHSNTPTSDTWQQDLEGPSQIPVFYQSGNAWVRDTPTDYALKQGTARIQYNYFNGASWSALDVPTDTHYTTSWIIATNNINYPVISIIGQSESNKISDEEALTFGDLILDGFPVVEFRPLYKIIWQTDSGYANIPNARIAGVYDIRQLTSGGGISGTTPVSDHGLLTGLGDDDHLQYIHTTETRTGVTAEFNTTGKITTTNKIGIGTVTPETLFDIWGSGSNTAQVSIRQYNNVDNDGPDIRFFAARGTISSPLAIQNGDYTGRFNSWVYNGTSFIQSGTFGWQSTGTDGRSIFSIANSDGTNVNTNLFITDTGIVAIGTTSPQATSKLEVQTPAFGGIRINALTEYPTLWLAQNGTDKWSITSNYNSDNGFVIRESGVADRINILPGGNVGIGTTNPGAKLTVWGSVTIGTNNSNDLGAVKAPFKLVNDNSAMGGGGAMINELYSSGTPQPGYIARFARGTEASPLAVEAEDRLAFFVGGGYGTTQFHHSASIDIFSEEAYTDSARGSYIRFTTTSVGQSSRVEKLRITGAGNVGIGTTNPASKLHVIGYGLFENTGGFGAPNSDNPANIPLVSKLTSSTGSTFFAAINGYGYPSFAINVDGGTNSTSDRGFVRFYDKTDGNWNNSINLNTGRVGIGTTNPGSTLAVNGYITENPGDGTYYNVVTQKDIGFNPNQIPLNQYLGQLAFMDDYAPFALRRSGGGTNDLVVSSDGNIGIGLSNPLQELHIYRASGNADIRIQGGGVETYIDLFHGSDSYGIWGTSTTGRMSFATSSTERLSISPTGNVGIGTTNPDSLLHLNAVSPRLKVQDSSGTNQFGTLQQIGAVTYLTGRNNTGFGAISITQNNGTTNQYPIYIDSSGRVGINTTIPGTRFDVYDTGYLNPRFVTTANSSVALQLQNSTGNYSLNTLPNTAGFSLYDITNAATRVLVSSTGNVGIGGITPSAMLDVGNNSVSNINLLIGADNSASTRTNATGKSARIAVPHYTNSEEPAAFAFIQSGSTFNDISIGGGTSLMNAATGISFYTTPNSTTPTGTLALIITGSGNVGIGTTNPTSKLHVQGSIIVAGSYETSNNIFAQGSASITGGVATSINQLSATVYRSVEYTIQAVQGTNYHVTKILAIHNGTDVSITEYGTIITNTSVASYSVDISGGNIVLTATPASASTTTFKLAIIGLKV